MMDVRRIVLIDDNDADTLYHSIVIKRSGFEGELLTFEDGPTALEFFAATDLAIPTLVFLDINMPGMDGFEWAERATPLLLGARSITIVVLTSSSQPYDRERAGRLELIHGFLTKPLTSVQMRDLLCD